jgi:hypothetical protein
MNDAGKGDRPRDPFRRIPLHIYEQNFERTFSGSNFITHRDPGDENDYRGREENSRG